MNCCFFVGHRTVPEEVRADLEAAVERHIAAYGVTDFVVGHYGAFDRMAKQAVLHAKQRHPEVTLSLLLPYYTPGIRAAEQEDFDARLYPPGMETVPKRVAIARANDHCGWLIVYVRRAGNARELLEYAAHRQRQGRLRITCL